MKGIDTRVVTGVDGAADCALDCLDNKGGQGGEAVSPGRDAGIRGMGGGAGTGGAAGLGGVTTSGGHISTGGQSTSGGMFGAGGSLGRAGSPGSGGRVGTGGTMGLGGVIGVGGGVGSGGITGAAGSGAPALVKLAGTLFGSGPPYLLDPNLSFEKAFDGDLGTYDDDSMSNDGYAGIDLGADKKSPVSIIRFYPRAGFNHRMLDGKFQCSSTSRTAGYVDLYTISPTPPQAWTEIAIANSPTCRYLRYLSPAGGHTDVAEVEFWGPSANDAGIVSGPADAGAPLVNLALGKPATASSPPADGMDASRGNDGLINTQYCPTNSTLPVWWKVDLGGAYSLVQSGINFEKGTAIYKYAIDVSVDGATWTTVVDQTQNTTRKTPTMIDALDARARWVRLTIAGASIPISGCFWEFSIWGNPTSS